MCFQSIIGGLPKLRELGSQWWSRWNLMESLRLFMGDAVQLQCALSRLSWTEAVRSKSYVFVMVQIQLLENL